MNKANVGMKSPPQFATSSDGKLSKVTLDTSSYVALLIKANITDQTFWPPGKKNGAKALKRIRQIESDCIAQYGEFDWEKLSEDLQDEYDRLCMLLDELSGDEEYIEWNISEQQNI